ncbi:MAG: Mu-like prophage major head subunit gpT family protein [Pseudomonadota bacterium]|nr:Mu-like prophage major head subunit gpT family protein [Pseudomonadota bacterium]
MSVINSGSFAKALWPGVNAWYGKSYDEYAVEYDQLFDKFTSNKAFEEDVGVSSFGLAVSKPEGAPVSYDSERQAFITRYQHVVYALGFIITREIMEDDQYDVVGQRKAQGLAFSMRQTKEVVAANVYNRAFNSAYVGGDGLSLINSAHVNLKGGTWSNQISTASDLSEAALEQACIDIAGFTNDAGLLIAVRPESLIIPRQLIFEAKRILGTDGRVGTDNNDLNAIKTLGSVPKVITNHFLTDTDAWFIRTNVPHGMKYFERRGDQFDMDNDWDTENAKFKASARYSFGWTDPRGLYASAGA